MNNRTVIIIGSSRQDGDTQKLIEQLTNLSGFDKMDLNDYNFSYYDYEHKNVGDDYLKLITQLINNYDVFVFATPVYWYSMSGIMKVFFDRITDLLDNEKDLGRKLRGKKMAVITTSVGDNLGESFWIPFVETARYLGMSYVGNLHTINEEDNLMALQKFVETIR